MPRRRRALSFLGEASDHRHPGKQIRAMRGLVQVLGQVGARCVNHLVPAFLPEEAAGYVVDFAPVCDVCRRAGFPIAACEIAFREESSLHRDRGAVVCIGGVEETGCRSRSPQRS